MSDRPVEERCRCAVELECSDTERVPVRDVIEPLTRVRTDDRRQRLGHTVDPERVRRPRRRPLQQVRRRCRQRCVASDLAQQAAVGGFDRRLAGRRRQRTRPGDVVRAARLVR